MKHETITSATAKPWLEDGYVGDFAARFFTVSSDAFARDGAPHWIDHLAYFDGTSGPARFVWKIHQDPDDVSSPVLDEGVIDIMTFPWLLNVPASMWHRVEPLTDRPVVHCCIFSGAMADQCGVSRADFNFERRSNG